MKDILAGTELRLPSEVIISILDPIVRKFLPEEYDAGRISICAEEEWYEMPLNSGWGPEVEWEEVDYKTIVVGFLSLSSRREVDTLICSGIDTEVENEGFRVDYLHAWSLLPSRCMSERNERIQDGRLRRSIRSHIIVQEFQKAIKEQFIDGRE